MPTHKKNTGSKTSPIFFVFVFVLSLLQPMDLVITILPVVTKDLPISHRFTPYDFLSRCKYSNLTTRQPMVEFYSLTFPRKLSVAEERTQILLW